MEIVYPHRYEAFFVAFLSVDLKREARERQVNRVDLVTEYINQTQRLPPVEE